MHTPRNRAVFQSPLPVGSRSPAKMDTLTVGAIVIAVVVLFITIVVIGAPGDMAKRLPLGTSIVVIAILSVLAWAVLIAIGTAVFELFKEKAPPFWRKTSAPRPIGELMSHDSGANKLI